MITHRDLMVLAHATRTAIDAAALHAEDAPSARKLHCAAIQARQRARYVARYIAAPEHAESFLRACGLSEG